MLPRLWRCTNMPLEERWCNTNFRCWRKVTLSRFQRHDVKRHHSEGKWCDSNFGVVKWHNLEERRCSLDLQGTRRCLLEISDAKHTLETWEDVHKRRAMPWRLYSQFFAAVIFYHNDLRALCSEQLTDLKQRPPIKEISKAYWWPLKKLFKLNWQSFFFSCDLTYWQILSCQRTPERD